MCGLWRRGVGTQGRAGVGGGGAGAPNVGHAGVPDSGCARASNAGEQGVRGQSALGRQMREHWGTGASAQGHWMRACRGAGRGALGRQAFGALGCQIQGVQGQVEASIDDIGGGLERQQFGTGATTTRVMAAAAVWCAVAASVVATATWWGVSVIGQGEAVIAMGGTTEAMAVGLLLGSSSSNHSSGKKFLLFSNDG